MRNQGAGEQKVILTYLGACLLRETRVNRLLLVVLTWRYALCLASNRA